MDSFEPAPPLIGLRGRQRIAGFTLARPTSLTDALDLRKARHSTWMAGGVDLIDSLKHGSPMERVIPLTGLAELRAIEPTDDGALRIGALTTYQHLADSELVRTMAPDLATLIGAVANIRIRSKATVGGSVMSGNGVYDLMPALLALGATLVLVGPEDEARIPAANLEATEPRLLRAVELPSHQSTRLSFDRTLRPVACVYLGIDLRDGVATSARLSVSCAHARPGVAAIALDGNDAETLAHRLASGLPPALEDGIASAAYRNRMIRILTRRLLDTTLNTTPLAGS
jgi:carbon-monoxide dehydrogenase medium subunit